MAKSELRTVWVASTGAEFKTEEEALEHEAQDELIKALSEDNSGIYWRDCCPSEVVNFLLQNYNITKKEVKS